METSLVATPELVHAARDLMHQGALFTLDIASGRTRQDLGNRAIMLQELRNQVTRHISQLPPTPNTKREAYWDMYYRTRASVCFKCAFRRDPDPQADLARQLNGTE